MNAALPQFPICRDSAICDRAGRFGHSCSQSG
jgi:hypothetical protein